jgi:hypothetical protein
MKRIKTIIFGLLLTTSLTANAAYAQNPSSTSTQNPSPNSTNRDTNITTKTPSRVLKDANGKQIGEVFIDEKGQLILIKKPRLTDGLNTVELNLNLLVVVLLTIICGGIGGVVFELLNLQGNIEKPHKPTEDELAAKLAYASRRNVIDLGVWARILIGAAAAPPAMLFLRPETAFGLLAMSVVAGSAGTAVFRSLQERLLLAVAQQEKTESETPAEKHNSKLEEAIDAFERLYQKVWKASEIQPKITELKFPKGLILDPEDFNEVMEFLIQAKCVKNPKVDEAIEAFNQLEKKVRDVSKSRAGKTELRISSDSNQTLDSKDFDEVKRLLREAQGVSETIVTGEAQEGNEPIAAADGSTTPPAKPSDVNPTANHHFVS